MSFVHMIILSVIQGLTEFIPVSSSGHLVLLPKLMEWQDQGLEIDVALHLGTLLAVFVYFWREIWMMIQKFFLFVGSGFDPKKFEVHTKLALSIVLATIPAVIAGYAIRKVFDLDLRYAEIIAFNSIFFGLVMYAADRWGKFQHKLMSMDFGKAGLIGIAQAFALIPGASRSGVCMSAARALGFDRVASAQYAFLLSIPVIIGGATLTGISMVESGPNVAWSSVGIMMALTFVIGIATIHFMIQYLYRYSLKYISIYRILLGAAILLTL